MGRTTSHRNDVLAYAHPDSLRGTLDLVSIDADIASRAMERDPERAEPLLAVLRTVDEGDLRADGPAGSAMVQQLRGALAALATMPPADSSG